MMSDEELAPEHTESMLNESDAPRLFAQSWVPAGKPRAVLAIVHGLAEHGGRYAATAYDLASRGYAVHALDLRGHGRSDGDRAYVRTFADYLDDLDRFVKHARSENLPFFVLGHSMGATVVALGAVTGRINADGIVLTGGALPGGGGPRGLMRAALALLANVIPKLPTARLDSKAVSRDPEVVGRYDADPLVFRGRLSTGLAAAFVRAMRRIERDVENFDLPLLLAHGGADTLVSADASRWMAENVSSDDVTLTIYDGLFHEVLNEPERDRLVADIAAWMDGRGAASGDSGAATA